MLTWLAELSPYFSPLNIFRYITFRTGGATATGILFVFLFGPRIISMLRLKQGKGQPIREDGPASHLLTKRGTPTMGGLMILAGVLVSTLLWANLANHYVWVVVFVTVGFGAIGFYDDFLKVTKQSHKGFSGRSRLALEALIAATACLAISYLGHARAREQTRSALLEGPDLQSRVVLHRLWRLRDRRRRQRGEHHGRARRPGDRARDDRGRNVRLYRVSGG